MNKAGIAALAAEKGRLDTVGTEIALMRIFKAMGAALTEGKEVYIEGFGGFEAFERKARNSRNPSTGETFVTPAKIVAKFKPVRKLREALLET